MSPELIPHVIERLLAAGAQDAWLTHITMKKGRPAYTLSVLGAPDEADALAAIIFDETTTLGVRRTPVEKTILPRETTEVHVAGHAVRVKVGYRGERITSIAPEHDDAIAVARATGMSLQDVYAAARAAAETGAPHSSDRSD
jgi:uncharacterized protein (DUF111 family)